MRTSMRTLSMVNINLSDLAWETRLYKTEHFGLKALKWNDSWPHFKGCSLQSLLGSKPLAILVEAHDRVWWCWTWSGRFPPLLDVGPVELARRSHQLSLGHQISFQIGRYPAKHLQTKTIYIWVVALQDLKTI